MTRWNKFKLGIDKLFGLWNNTAHRCLTTYHYPVERRGKFSGVYYHRKMITDDWQPGFYPMRKTIG